MRTAQAFVIRPDAQSIKHHPTLSRQVRELSETYEDNSIAVDNKRLQTVGELLWMVLNLGNQLDLAKQQASDSSLPIIIESDDGLVISLPWETLYHPEYGFLAQHPEFTLTRRMPKAKKFLPEPECAPLRVLLFTSLPDDLSEHERLQIEDEQAAVLQTLATAEQEGRVELEMPDDGRFDSFKATLQRFKPHVVYFSGHGKFDYEHHNNKAWAIFQFEDEWGKQLAVEENEIRDCLIVNDVQALVLSACESAKSHKDYADNGLAQCLHVAGIPHVIGMRESVYDIAGLEFAKGFFTALCQAQPIDQALQQARNAIQKMPKHRNADEHWCLPAQFSQDLNQPLVNWSFEPQPRGQVQSTRESVNGISLPPKFIGRRRELREWQNALRSGDKPECLIIGAGGMGKTALAGKLLDSLKRDDYEVFGLSVRPDEEHDWRKSLSELEQLLKDEFLIKQYQTALGEATTIETPEDLEEPPTVTVDESKRAEALLDGLLRQYDGQFALLIDNLESVQDEQNRQVNDPVLASWIEVARGFSDRGLKLILTSRWQLPEWGENSLCVLGRPVFADYVAFIRELNLPVRFMGNAERVREVFEQLGGNYRALTFFAAAVQGMTLGAEQEFLEKLGQAKEEIQVDMAIEQVYEQLDESQREVLNLMRVYLYPVDMEGIRRIALPEYGGVEGIVESLVAVSLLERYWHEELEEFEYVVSSLVWEFLKNSRIVKPELNLHQEGALYFLELLENGRKKSWQQCINTYTLLKLSMLQDEASQLAVNIIIPHISNAGGYNELIKKWLPPLLNSKKNEIKIEALSQMGNQYFHIGDSDNALKYLHESLALYESTNDHDKIIGVINSISLVHSSQGNYNDAIKQLQKTLSRKTNNKKYANAIYNNLATNFYAQGNFNRALKYFKKAKDIQVKEDLKKDMSKNLSNISSIYLVKGKYEKALNLLREPLIIQRETGDKNGEGITLNNISQILKRQGFFDEALAYLRKAEDIQLAINDKPGLGATLNNISQIYDAQGNYDIALKYLETARKYQLESGEKVSIARTLNNIAGIYWAEEKYESALTRLKEALSIQRNIGDVSGEETTLNNIAQIYSENGRDDEALVILKKALVIQKKISDKSAIAGTYGSIATIFHQKNNHSESYKYINKSLNILREIGDIPGLCNNLINAGHIMASNDEITEGIKLWAEAYKLAKQINLYDVLKILEGFAQQLELPGGLDAWEKISQRIDEL